MEKKIEFYEIIDCNEVIFNVLGLIHMKDSRYKGNTSDSSCSTFVKILETLPTHPSVDIWSRCGTTAPDAIAACVPNEIQPEIIAPLIAPQMAPKLLLHGTSMPRVKIPNVVPAAMADNEVATLNKIKSFLVKSRSLYFQNI